MYLIYNIGGSKEFRKSVDISHFIRNQGSAKNSS